MEKIVKGISKANKAEGDSAVQRGYYIPKSITGESKVILYYLLF